MLTYDDVHDIIHSFINPVFTVVLLSGQEISINSDDCYLEDHYMMIGRNTYIPYSAIAMLLF